MIEGFEAFSQVQSSVRIRSIAIRSSIPEQAPKKIKLVVNRPTVGFEDVEDTEEPEVAQVLRDRVGRAVVAALERPMELRAAALRVGDIAKPVMAVHRQ